MTTIKGRQNSNMTDIRRKSGRFGRLGLITGVLASLAATAGCTQPPLGPSLTSVTLDGISLQPTQGNATLCCCRVVGGATNRNSVAVHVTLKFAAFDGTSDKAIGTVFYFIKDLQPNQRANIDASGFLFSCSQAKQLKTEIDVNGLITPPE
jgi:hypothetical protein